MSEYDLPKRVTTATDNNSQIRMGQCDCDRAILWLRWQPHRLGTLELLERRQGAHPFLYGLQFDCLDVLSVPRYPVWQHVW